MIRNKGRALMLSAALAMASSTAVDAQQSYSVPAGTLSAALNELGRQAGVGVVAPADVVGGVTTDGVQDAQSVKAALDRILAGTGLEARITPSGAIIVTRPAALASESGTLLDPISVDGDLNPDAVLGYNPVQTRSATRTDTPLSEVPQTVNVVGRKEIDDRHVQSLTEAVETIPNVQLNSTSGNRGDTFIVRGFSTAAYAIDGTTLSAAEDRPPVFLDFANVENVEVLKGPAAVLYGQGEPGGVINVVTRRAEATPSGEISASAGSYGLGRIEGTATGALDKAGRVRARVSGSLNTDGGFQTERPDSQRQFVSGLLEWDATDDTTLSFGVDYTHQHQPFDRGLIVGEDNQVLSDHSLWLGEDWSMVDSRQTRVTIKSETRVSDALTLRSQIAYTNAYTADSGIDLRGLEEDGRTLDRRWTDRIEDQQNVEARVEAEADLTTGPIDHTVLTGLQYDWAQMKFQNARANIDPIDIYDPVYGAEQVAPSSLKNKYIQTVEHRSAYLQDQIDLSDRWKMLAGVRYDSYDIRRDVIVGNAFTPDSDGDWTGRLGLVYQLSPQLSLYGSWSQSFVPQSGADEDGNALPAEEGEQYEIGMKYDTGAVSTTLSAFQITKSNVATSDPDDPDADWSVVTGEQRVRGIEAEVTGALGAAWHLHGSVGLLDAVITKDEDYAVGNRLTGVPKVNASLWATYQPQTEKWRDWTFGAGVVHVGEREGDLDNDFQVPGYTRLDASVEWQPRDSVGVQLMVRNLTDESYILTPVGRNENYAGAPRTFVAKLTYRF